MIEHYPNGKTTKNTVYDSAEFGVAGTSSDYNVSTQQAKAFNNVKHAYYLKVRTDTTIKVALNAAANDVITMTPEYSPYEIDNMDITNVFIDNENVTTATVKVFLA